MDHSDNDMQGTEGTLCGPDVRRRIPIKLLPKQARNKPARGPQRPAGRLPSKTHSLDEEGFNYKQEERFDSGTKSGDAFASQRRFPQQLFWDFKLRLIGEKDDIPVHFCDKCGLPIKSYGRMIPCKHVFCHECALHHERKGDKMCPGLNMYSCTDPVQRIEQCLRGSLYMCSIVQGCKRTYLSQRDLQAHINHRHIRAGKASSSRSDSLHLPPSSEVPERFRVPPPHLPPPHLAKPHVGPPPMSHGGHDPYSQPPPSSHDDHRPPPGQPPAGDMGPPRSLSQETFRISTVTTRKHSNLITVPIHDDSGSSGPSREPLPQPGNAPPPHHHPGDYPGHPHHMMGPPQQHYGPPPPPPINHPMPHPGQGSNTPHMVFNQAPPPLSSVPPPITPPPGHLLGQMPPFMNHPPPGPPPQHGGPPQNAPPPHHYNPQFPEDKSTLSPPFNQPGGLSPGMWPAPRGPPPRLQGPPQGQMPGPHHPDQGRYRPYYQ